jgi:hypothetical protein
MTVNRLEADSSWRPSVATLSNQAHHFRRALGVSMMQMDDPYQAVSSAASPMPVGELMRVAARLMSVAKPLGQQAEEGEILITDATYRDATSRMVREAVKVEKAAYS